MLSVARLQVLLLSVGSVATGSWNQANNATTRINQDAQSGAKWTKGSLVGDSSPRPVSETIQPVEMESRKWPNPVMMGTK